MNAFIAQEKRRNLTIIHRTIYKYVGSSVIAMPFAHSTINTQRFLSLIQLPTPLKPKESTLQTPLCKNRSKKRKQANHGNKHARYSMPHLSSPSPSSDFLPFLPIVHGSFKTKYRRPSSLYSYRNVHPPRPSPKAHAHHKVGPAKTTIRNFSNAHAYKSQARQGTQRNSSR